MGGSVGIVGSVGIKKTLVFWSFSLRLSKNQGKEEQGTPSAIEHSRLEQGRPASLSEEFPYDPGAERQLAAKISADLASEDASKCLFSGMG